MVNIIAERKIMPEYLQNQANTDSITKEAFKMLSSSEIQNKMKNEVLRVQRKLESKGASQRAAEHILSLAGSQ